MISFIVTAIVFFLLGRYLPYFLGSLVYHIKREKAISKILPTQVKKSQLCKDPHQWISAMSGIDDNGDFKYTNVCKVCGFIPKLNMMATKEGLVQMELNKQYLEEDNRMRDEFIATEEAAIRSHFTEEIKNGVSFQKLTQLYLAGSTVKDRMLQFRMNKMRPNTEVDSVQRQ